MFSFNVHLNWFVHFSNKAAVVQLNMIFVYLAERFLRDSYIEIRDTLLEGYVSLDFN